MLLDTTNDQLRRMSVECLLPTEREWLGRSVVQQVEAPQVELRQTPAWRDLVEMRPLRALGRIVGKPWPTEPE